MTEKTLIPGKLYQRTPFSDEYFAYLANFKTGDILMYLGQNNIASHWKVMGYGAFLTSKGKTALLPINECYYQEIE